jgi:hypothetical protein
MTAHADAAERTGRLTVDVKIDGPGQARAGSDWARYTTSQSVHMAFTVTSSGEGEQFNMVDDAGTTATLAKQNAAMQAKMPSIDRQQAFAQKMQAEAQACGGDVACMQKVALKMAQQQAAWTPMPTQSPEDGRYFNYSPTSACKGEFAAKIADSVEGAFADVAGPRPFTGRTTAAIAGDKLQVATLCTGAVTVDGRTGKLYARLSMPRLDGRHVGTEAGRIVLDSPRSEVLVNHEAWQWAVAQLQGASRAGMQRTVLNVPINSPMGGKGQHELSVEVRWAFVAN